MSTIRHLVTISSHPTSLTHATQLAEQPDSQTELMILIPLSVIDASTIWWIFLSISSTVKVLNLRCVACD